MIRKIIQIDSDKCNGCGACARACHEGAIGNGRRQGAGCCARTTATVWATACPPARQTPSRLLSARPPPTTRPQSPLQRRVQGRRTTAAVLAHPPVKFATRRATQRQRARRPAWKTGRYRSSLRPCAHRISTGLSCWWPPTARPMRGSFHEDFIRGRSVLIGCPKLDGEDYSQKLRAILHENDIRSVTLTRMRVPCCGALERMLRAALEDCGRDIPLKVAVIDMNGDIMA